MLPSVLTEQASVMDHRDRLGDQGVQPLEGGEGVLLWVHEDGVTVRAQAERGEVIP
jgi:hypothetical protein